MITVTKKRKLVKQIKYKDLTIDEFILLVNKSLQIKLSDKFDLINEICDHYPLVSKKDVSMITKAFFDVMRESLMAGEVINFNKTFSNMKLMIYKHHRDNKDYVSVKVKISTPEGVK
jgi:nucleoid DNA-binding protein